LFFNSFLLGFQVNKVHKAPFKGLKFYVICSTFYVQFWGVEFIEFVAFIEFIEFIGFFGFESRVKVFYLLFIELFIKYPDLCNADPKQFIDETVMQLLIN